MVLLQDVASFVGAVSGLVSLGSIAYFAGRWKGKIEGDVSQIMEERRKYPLAECFTMTKTLWDVYVMDALRKHPNIATHSSPWRLTEEGRQLIPLDITKKLDHIPEESICHNSAPTGFIVAEFIGISDILILAEKTGMSMQATIAILSTYLEEKKEEVQRR